jgi:hypothetical protein
MICRLQVDLIDFVAIIYYRAKLQGKSGLYQKRVAKFT